MKSKVPLFFLILLLSFTSFFTVNSSMGPRHAFASGSKQADPNQVMSDANDPNQKDKKPLPPTHDHPAFDELSEQRQKMVHRQIERRGVSDPNVLSAMRTVPRHAFVRPGDLRRAYDDSPLPIGLGQTISQPYIVAYMTEFLKLDPNSKVLEIGTGSGYQAAVCAEIAAEVYTIEILEELAESAEKRLKELGYRNVSVKAADGYFGWLEKGPFDAIIVTCAAGFVPPPLTQQLKLNGIMILPLGSPYGAQRLVLITKDHKGKILSRGLIPVRFVPMLGQITETKQ
jgi:protein-L-isoaspartate(D-aspartate) O-methyltransferase